MFLGQRFGQVAEQIGRIVELNHVFGCGQAAPHRLGCLLVAFGHDVGLEAADGKSCVHTIVEDTTERATVAYSCRGLGSGRTTIVKDNRNHFTIDAQGIRGREPFAVRQEFKRVGDC